MTTPRFSAWLGTDHAMPWHTNRNGGLVQVPSGKGLDLRASGPVIPLCGHGAIIGHLFERGAVSRRVRRLEPDRIERIVATKGASLVREFWGGYVAFLLDAQGGWHILRDPSGTLPIYWRRLAAGIALASGLEEPPFRYQDGVGIDYEALCLHLGAAHHAGTATCLAGVSELLAGEELCLGNDGVRNTALWSPWDHVHDHRQDAQVTADELHAVVSDVVAAWGDVFASVLLGMSGGLDSSIVAAALHRSRTRVRGVTLYWPDGEGDERAWARLAAQSAGVDLQEAAYRFSDVDLDAPVVRNTSRPQLSFHVQALAATDDVLGHPEGYISGHGGDNVFGMIRSVTPVLDAMLDLQGPLAIMRTIADVARLNDADLPTILLHLARRLARHPSRDAADLRFLDVGRFRTARDEIASHPWNRPPSPTPAGRAAHVRSIRRAHGHDGIHSRTTHPPMICPLLAQPVVELCLRIPSWRWIARGQDRSVARDAFAGDLPAQIVARRSKGGPSGFTEALFLAHQQHIVRRLHDGLLNREGVVHNLPAPDERLSLEPGAGRRLLALLAAENWAQAWQQSSR